MLDLHFNGACMSNVRGTSKVVLINKNKNGENKNKKKNLKNGVAYMKLNKSIRFE